MGERFPHDCRPGRDSSSGWRSPGSARPPAHPRRARAARSTPSDASWSASWCGPGARRHDGADGLPRPGAHRIRRRRGGRRRRRRHDQPPSSAPRTRARLEDVTHVLHGEHGTGACSGCSTPSTSWGCSRSPTASPWRGPCSSRATPRGSTTGCSGRRGGGRRRARRGAHRARARPRAVAAGPVVPPLPWVDHVVARSARPGGHPAGVVAASRPPCSSRARRSSPGYRRWAVGLGHDRARSLVVRSLVGRRWGRSSPWPGSPARSAPAPRARRATTDAVTAVTASACSAPRPRCAASG